MLNEGVEEERWSTFWIWQQYYYTKISADLVGLGLFPEDTIMLSVTLQSKPCFYLLVLLWLCLGNTKKRVGRVYPSMNNFCSLAATLRVFRLNSLEKQLFCAYMKCVDSSNLLHHCRIALGTGWILGADFFHLQLLRNKCEGPSGIPCSEDHSDIFSFFFMKISTGNWCELRRSLHA